MINSNLGPISHSFRDMASFPLKRTFSYPSPFNPKFENVFLALHSQNFVRREPRQRTNYSCKIFPLRPNAWPQYIRDPQTDR